MFPKNKLGGTNGQQNKGSNAITIIILVVFILIFFFWRFIDYRAANWTGTAKEGFPSAIVISNSSFAVTEYNSDYLRWAGQVNAGQYATWGKITIEQNEIPIGGATGPRSPCIIYGNIRETTGAGVNLMIFDEANYTEWRNGKKDASINYIKNDVFDFNYVLDISQGSYYIVIDNTGNTKDAFVGFTGVQAWVRPLNAGETPSRQNQYFEYKWDIKNEKITLWEYILKLFKPPYNVSVTPPAMSGEPQ